MKLINDILLEEEINDFQMDSAPKLVSYELVIRAKGFLSRMNWVGHSRCFWKAFENFKFTCHQWGFLKFIQAVVTKTLSIGMMKDWAWVKIIR